MVREGVSGGKGGEAGKWLEELRLALLVPLRKGNRNIPTDPRSSCGLEVSLWLSPLEEIPGPSQPSQGSEAPRPAWTVPSSQPTGGRGMDPERVWGAGGKKRRCKSTEWALSAL